MAASSTTTTAVRLPAYARLQGAYHEANSDQLQQIIDRLPLPQDARVLDVPCGDGFYCSRFLSRLQREDQRQAILVGADQSPDFLHVARERLQQPLESARTHLHRADIYRLPYSDGTFDLVWCAQSMISLEQREAALRELARVVRPGGHVAVLENDDLHQLVLPWPAELELAIHQAAREAFRRKRRDPERLEAARHLEEIFTTAGLPRPRRSTFTLDYQPPLQATQRRYLQLYLEDLRERVYKLLDSDAQAQFDRYASQNSPHYLLDQSSFAATSVDVLFMAQL